MYGLSLESLKPKLSGFKRICKNLMHTNLRHTHES